MGVTAIVARSADSAEREREMEKENGEEREKKECLVRCVYVCMADRVLNL